MLPRAASGAVTRTFKSRKVMVSLFRIPLTPFSTSTGVAVPDEGVSIVGIVMGVGPEERLLQTRCPKEMRLCDIDVLTAFEP